MSLIPLTIPPGIYRNGTAYQSSGRWYDGNLMRFFANTIRPFGGWIRRSDEVLDGPGRGMLTWRPDTFNRQAVIGTPNSLYLWDDQDFTDITPAIYTPGIENGIYGLGYGAGPYGMGPYGLGLNSGITEATTWAMDTWGDHAVMCATHDRVIYEYANDGLPAFPVPNSPSAKSLFVTAEGILVAVGADGDLRSVAWCDIRDNTNWVADYTSAAGDFRLSTDGTLVAGRAIRGGNLLFTTTDLHKFVFIGQPLIFSFSFVSRGCGLIGPNVVQVLGSGSDVIWMGQNEFFRYNGQVSPVPCEIHDYIFSDINVEQAAKFSSGQITDFGEVLFWYCSAGSTELDRCVSYNDREGHWNIVDPYSVMARGCWSDVGAFPKPHAVGTDGILYRHEDGWTNDGDPITTDRYLKSGPIEISRGDNIMEATILIPDEVTPGKLTVEFEGKFTPEGPSYSFGPYTATPYTDVRVTARQVGVTLRSTEDEDFRFGRIRLEASPGGAR